MTGSCAEVWSVTASGRTPRFTSSGKISAALPSNATEMGFFSLLCLVDDRQRVVEVFRLHVDIAGLQPHLDAARLALDRQARSAGHRRRKRLRAAHAAEAGSQDPAAGQIAAIVLAAKLDERLVGALNDALAPDIDPRAGRHLAVHHQALLIERVEMVPVRPVRHQVRIGEQHTRRVGMGLEDADRLAGLNQQRLVVFQFPQGADDAIETFPVARCTADAAIDDQLARLFGNARIEVVHQHAQRRFGQPALGGKFGAGRRADRRVHCRCGCAGHENLR